NSGTPTASPVHGGSVAGVELPVPEGELRDSVSRDAIPAIVDPAFGPDWSDLEIEVENPFAGNKVLRPRLEPEDRVIAVERAGEARAYPLKLL
ncbi:MAG: DUF3179 domain-containing protein, partial [Actinobacteria bacterium]|nr:DUF3179 domain-containing protein [Actinomycetota bacterium]NIU68488.1 DUF3179 domain-containing protein [Actinomycetota bacterium]NIW30313.1 DUF3179 domain-containing protein [Actinomycetota bacterium]NIX22737.1 DUF3179 domain-containing protein [Actinomycetota bacterium]